MAERTSTKQTRELMESISGFDESLYRQLLAELGVGGIHVPEEYGGAGLSYEELAIVLEEMGRVLYPSPFFSSHVLATNALLLVGSPEQKAEWLPKIASGEVNATVAFYEDSNLRDLRNFQQTVQNGRFTGSKERVTDAFGANLIIVIAPDAVADRMPCFWLARCGRDADIRYEPTNSIDETRRIGEVGFYDVPVERLGDGGHTQQLYSQFIDFACVALANEMVGGAQWLLESAVEYANNRVQFGRPISSMQAIKHKCADLLLEVEFAKSAAYRAATAIAEGDSKLPEYASIAKAASNTAYMQAANDAIQIHGGIGFTWDNDTHLWYKRAKSSEVFFGTTEMHRETLMQRIDLAEGA